MLSMIYSFSKAMQEFPLRHREATTVIERIYAYFAQNNSWPAQTEVEASGQRWLPPEWEYGEAGTDPVILLHGPHHMKIVYYFTRPSHGPLDRTWTLSIEGDKRTFQSDDAYKMQSP